MAIVNESAEQKASRLKKGMAMCEFKAFPGLYEFTEFSSNSFKEKMSPNALVLIRDGEQWSQLAPADSDSKIVPEKTWKIFSFHFDPSSDMNGFIGWLANHIMKTIGVGIIVNCGTNTNKQGIYDYWGCPPESSERVISEIRRLINAK